MNARSEAYERLGGRYEVRVLEPSPPAVNEAPFFADDPVAVDDLPPGRDVVSPVGNGSLRWSELAVGNPELAAWCSERWLGPYRRLGPVPENFVQTRVALHRLAEHVISPARREANSKIGLRYTRGGFGTPFFGDDVQLRVFGTELIVDRGGEQHAVTISTLRGAARALGVGVLPAADQLDDEPLAVDPSSAEFLGDWYGFAASVLEELRTEAGGGLDPSRVQLWPEHFDLALELGAQDAGARAAYGLSPGDEQHQDPYIYVAPWVTPPPGELWQARGFPGAELSYAELLEAGDQREAALRFLRARVRALND